MIKKILIVSGDPNSINSEIIYKVWKKLNISIKKKIYLISNYKLICDQFKKLKYKVKVVKVKNTEEKSYKKALKIIDVNLKFKNSFKVNINQSSKYIINSLNLAHKLSLNSDVLGLVNCPINKNLLNRKNLGVTEYLASKCRITDGSEVMLITNKKLSICPITTHVDLKDVVKKISSKKIINKVRTIKNWYKKKFKIKPKIGILGLNPHNSELKKNSEEKKIIIPTIKKLKKMSFNVNGPLIGDTLFIKSYKEYDVLIGMYHDQIITPFKTIYKFDAINVTLGLKYLRVSPDHGTAIDLIKKNKADPTSLLKCIQFVDKFGR